MLAGRIYTTVPLHEFVVYYSIVQALNSFFARPSGTFAIYPNVY